MNVSDTEPGKRRTPPRKPLTVEVALDASPENLYYWRVSLQLLAIIHQRRKEANAAPTKDTKP